MNICTCIAPVNIAVVKYWGKRDEELILPLNDSISATLNTDDMYAQTTIMMSADFTEDRMWLNGREEDLNNPRLQRCLKEMRKKAMLQEGSTAFWKIHICSKNNFPTAAGLASSAAGYACLVYTLARLWGIEDDITKIARQGSGSACRSIYGGFVRWHKGVLPNGEDSIATQLIPNWPKLHILILVVSDERKGTSSTSGMQRSVQTSELLKHRVQYSVPSRIESMTKAVLEQDFQLFAELTMKDSNQFHAVCLDTYPPAVYLNDTSHAIIRLIHRFNDECGEIKVAYTFDAGPNACLYMMAEDVPRVASLIKKAFPPNADQEADFFRGSHIEWNDSSTEMLQPDVSLLRGNLRYIIHTRVGDGPRQVENHLLSPSGMPI